MNSNNSSDDSDYATGSDRNSYGTKNYTKKVPRTQGIPAVQPVPYCDFSQLEGYNPFAFVKPSNGVEENREVIAKLRRDKPEVFDTLDLHIEEYSNDNTKEKFQVKKEAVKIIKNLLPLYDPDQSFHICGSTMNGLGKGGSDIDLCWVIPVFSKNEMKPSYPTSAVNGFNPIEILMNAKTLLQPYIRPYYVILRDSARVPILRFIMDFGDVQLRVDLNLNNIAGIYNTFMLAEYAKIDERFPMLAKVVRTWGKQSGIIDPANGGLSSYAIYLMILHFLQCGISPPILPNLIALRHDLFDGTLDLQKLEERYDLGSDIDISLHDWNPSYVGDLLIGFLRYYGFFSYQSDGIFIRFACADKKTSEDTFLLEEVYDLITVPKNLESDDMKYIKTTFLDAYSLLIQDPNFHHFINNKKVFLKNL